MKTMKYLATWLCLLAMLVGMMTFVSCTTGTGGDGTTGESTTDAPTEENTTAKPEENTTAKPTDPTTPGEDEDTTGQYSKAPVMLSFGDKGNAGYFSNSSEQHGLYEYDTTKEAVKLGYGSGYYTSADGGCYLFMPKFVKNGDTVTAEHKFIRVYLSIKHPDGTETANYVIQNNASGATIRFDDLANTNGFALTPVSVDTQNAITSRMSTGMHCSNIIYSSSEGGEYYVKAIFFFDNMADARLFTATDAENLLAARTTEDAAPQPIGTPSATMGFVPNGTATPLDPADATGHWTYDDEKLAVKLDYTNAANSAFYKAGYGYSFVPKFNQTNMVHNGVGDVSKKDGYVRVLYSVKNPTGVDSVDMSLIESVTENKMITWAGLTDTNGFALTETTEFPVALALIGRFMRCENNAIAFKTTAEGGEYYIKAVFFFKSPTEADALTVSKAERLISTMAGITPADTVLSFGTNGNFAAYDDAGKGTVGTDSNTALYQTTSFDEMNWWLHGGFTNASAAGMTATHKYARIVYKLTGAPDGGTFRFMAGDGKSKFSGVITAADTKTLSSVITLSDESATRLSSTGNWAGFFGVSGVPTDGVTFELYAIYFFETEAEANAFTLA